MDINSILATFPALAPYVVYITAFTGLMALIAQFLPAPSATSSQVYDAVYSFVNWSGWNNLHATNATAPLANTVIKVPKLGWLLAIGLALTLSACGNPAAQADVQPCLMSIAPTVTPQVQAIAADGTQTDTSKAIASAKVVAVDAAASPACLKLAADLQTKLAQ